MTDLTIITPIHPEHGQQFMRCMQSVNEQKVPVKHLFMEDTHLEGPGRIRNKLLEKVATKYVTFLDADDWLEPEFAEQMLANIQIGKYLFCDWYQDGKHVEAHPHPWCNKKFHLITSVVTLEAVRLVGYFNESLPGMEDTDLWLRMNLNNICGVRYPVPLVHYSANGGRGLALRQSGEIDRVQAQLSKWYGGKPMGCCGDNQQTPVDREPSGDRQPGDVLAQANWSGNRNIMGKATGRRYPRMSKPKRAWVAPADIDYEPHLWTIIEEKPDEEILKNSREAAGAFFGQEPQERDPYIDLEPVKVDRKPNVQRIKRMVGYQRTGKPKFVKPRTDYPSYNDFWKLVELSGYEIVHDSENLYDNPSDTFIIVGPMNIPNMSRTAAHVIFWQFEYAGDYTNQANIETCDEVWASDPHYAKQHGYKFVMMGSHPGLNPWPMPDNFDKSFDVTMLAYLTERRKQIKVALKAYQWSEPDYPGHEGMERHKLLSSTKLMLHVHQHNEPALSPMRYALAAAYKLPVIAEQTPDTTPYDGYIHFAEYDDIPSAVKLYFDGKLDDGLAHWGAGLYRLLCIERPFSHCVKEALK